METLNVTVAIHISEHDTKNNPSDKDRRRVGLREYSPKDVKWDEKRCETLRTIMLLMNAGRFTRWAERMQECANWLIYAVLHSDDTGEVILRLRNANLCHCRHCFVCNWRRSLMYYARFSEFLPAIAQEHPKARWVLMTLTVPNMPVGALRDALTDMNAAWRRFAQRKEFKPVIGWIRTTEVTQGKDSAGNAHPHFHVLLMVPPSMLSGKNYVKQSRWLEIWRECMRDDSITQLDVRTVKDQAGAISELTKAVNYSLKPEISNASPEWMFEYFAQVHHKRFLAAGGVLKPALKKILEPETTEDLIFTDENPKPEENSEEMKKVFAWDGNAMQYLEKD